MSLSAVLALLLLLSTAGYLLGRRKAVVLAEGNWRRLHSLPSYHGLFVALWMLLPALLLLAAWLLLEPRAAEWLLRHNLPAAALTEDPSQLKLLVSEVRNHVAQGRITELDPTLRPAAEAFLAVRETGRWLLLALLLLAVAVGLWRGRASLSLDLKARNRVEGAVTWIMILGSTVAVLTTLGIVLSLLVETWRFFDRVPLGEFLFGLQWSPQTALRSDQVGASGTFGAVPLFVGTLLITLIAMAVAVPVGLFSAIYLSEYAGRGFRTAVKPTLEVLAGIPTVVYGFFAALTVAPFLSDAGGVLGLDVASESALAAGLVMGIMIIPFVSSLSDDVMTAVPQSLRDGAYALGATRSETIRQVVLPAALPGIVGSVLLAVSRAIGETMIVVMAAGLAANLTLNPLEAVTTVTVQIVTLLVGDQEFDSAKTLSAFALGLLLFLITLGLNVVALSVVRKYREKYD